MLLKPLSEGREGEEEVGDILKIRHAAKFPANFVHAEWSVSNTYQIVLPDVSYLKMHVPEVLWTDTVLSLVMVMAMVVIMLVVAVVMVTWC